MDSGTRRIAIGIGLLAAGFVVYGVSAYYMRGIIIPEIWSGQYCEGSSCLQSILIASIGSIAGGILALVGVILTLLATFRKLGRPS